MTIGRNCSIAPIVGIYTAGQPLDAQWRNQVLEYAYPVTIGVWIGAGASILSGTVIGSGGVIAANSVVRDTVLERVICGSNCRGRCRTNVLFTAAFRV
nr:hypothetical protein [Paracoccus hibiscisoli]